MPQQVQITIGNHAWVGTASLVEQDATGASEKASSSGAKVVARAKPVRKQEGSSSSSSSSSSNTWEDQVPPPSLPDAMPKGKRRWNQDHLGTRLKQNRHDHRGPKGPWATKRGPTKKALIAENAKLKAENQVLINENKRLKSEQNTTDGHGEANQAIIRQLVLEQIDLEDVASYCGYDCLDDMREAVQHEE